MITPSLRREIAAARRWAREERQAGLRASSAHYDATRERVAVELTNGVAFAFPIEVVPGMDGATTEQRMALELSPSGWGITWPALDADISVRGLLLSTFDRRVIARALAEAGGRVRSPAKAAAARANGAKGGRPRKAR